jgi:phosphoglycolate phosphatase-like HAD superfamily hydrolase
LKLFDSVITADDTQDHKPHPEPLLLACGRLGIKPEEAVYVGDSLLDYEAAKRAKVKFIAVLSGDVSKEEFKKNGVKNVIPSVAELPEFLRAKKWTGSS